MSEALAWAAGLFEGEGTIAPMDAQGRFQLALVMTDRDVVERFARVVGRGPVRPSNPPSRASHCKDQWRWSVTSREDVRYVYALLEPWLGARRRQRAAELIAADDDGRAAILERLRCSTCGRPFVPKRLWRNTEGKRQRFCSGPCRETWFLRFRRAPARVSASQPSLFSESK